ncbi:phosphoenolpyruvate--protein phosphotransferase [Pontibacter sp. JAM-7]|uniref:phosphoenolpyruvate--protein phosphotransferase n=1 Tax=Pontibacter sp. JAM-7 TaxID=3366581 RepID=UPI003AF623AA
MKNLVLELTRIVQAVAMVESPEEQVRLIVDSISEYTGADVCSLYRINDQQEMQLLASHGLDITGRVTIPAGKGLVGKVAQTRHPINLGDAASHPDFYYVQGSHEERYKSYCGVPLVRSGKVIGALVVQSVLAEPFSDESEAMLLTLASQLAFIVSNLPSNSSHSEKNLRASGIRGAPGVGIGRVVLCDSDELSQIADASCDDIDVSLQQWRNLLVEVCSEIDDERAALGDELSDSVASIFDTYQMLLEDRSFTDRVVKEIQAGHWLPGALRLTVNYFTELFRAMDDPYLRARHEDIQHLGNKLYRAWRGGSVEQSNFTEPVVLIAPHVSVSAIASVPPELLAGVICFEGSSLSHTAVLANAVGVPAVMGVGELKGIHSGGLVIVDGNEGHLIFNPTRVVAAEYRRILRREKKLVAKLDQLRDLPAITRDEHYVQLLTNTGLLADITPGLNSGAEGVGLYRTEIPFMVRDSFPTEEEQVQVYRKVAEAYHDKPVYMRTLDVGGDKQLPYFPITNEANPALGWRGIRFTLDNIQLLMTQVRAMIRAFSGHEQLHILLPMVSSTVELDSFIQLLDDACAQLQEEGLAVKRPKIGVMIEVPAAIAQLHFWHKKIDFVSIGSNDLSQYLLSLDRNNSRVAPRYDHVHPAVLHEIKRVVNTAKRYDLPLSVCGEMAADPVAVVLLLGMGVRKLSMSAAKLPQIKWLIRSLSIAEAEALLKRVMKVDNVERIRQKVNKEFDRLELREVIH